MVGHALRLLPLVLLVFGALPSITALAVPEGPSCVLSTTGSLRPQETIDRLVAAGNGQMVLIVGGFASNPADMRFYAPLARRFSGYEVNSFGQGEFGYDTLGDADVNGVGLCEEVRRSVRRDDLGEVHLVGHSMGALTIDRAVSHSLGATDNVASYTALAGAHNGAFAAFVANAAAQLAPDTSELARRLIGLSGKERAVRSLADLRSARAPKGVRTLNVRSIEDEMVLARDSHLEGAREATLALNQWGAHGAIARNRRALDLVEANVRGNPVTLTYDEEYGNAAFRSILDLLQTVALLAGGVALVGFDPRAAQIVRLPKVVNLVKALAGWK